jgi:antitoxin (DNA-binding transcriptional repressor) of toxin-antitoxin stability system
MSHTLTIEEAARRLADLVSALQPGDEIQLTAENRLVARITPEPKAALPHHGFGSCRGMLIENLNVDENAHLAEFKDYL